MGLGLRLAAGPGQWGKGRAACSEGSPTPSSPHKPCPGRAHLAVAWGQGQPTSTPQAPAPEGGTLYAQSFLAPTIQRLFHEGHHSLLIWLPLETGIPMQSACCLLSRRVGAAAYPHQQSREGGSHETRALSFP